MNPAFAMKYAIRQYKAVLSHQGNNQFLGPKGLVEASESLSEVLIGDSIKAEAKETLVDHPMWQRVAGGAPNGAPEHVFVLMMESYDSWPFQDKFAELNIVPYGKKLGDEGVRLMRFMPGDNHSVSSVNILEQGLFETSRVAQFNSPTSMVHIFKRLGYQTRHIAGFSSETGSAGRYSAQQGFDESYFTADIVPGGETPNNHVFDGTLFRYVAERMDYRKPTLTFIRTISNHGPWHVDLKAEDCYYDKLPAHLENEEHRDNEELLAFMGHMKYSDKVMGEFVERMIKRFPRALFVITGDHYGRHSFVRHPNVFERSAVPLILYGPEILKGLKLPENCAGSHIDVGTTITELSAPKGFAYVSMGRNLFAPQRENFGIGNGFVIFPDCVVGLSGGAEHEPMPEEFAAAPFDPSAAKARIEQAEELHRAYHGLGYELAAKFLEDSRQRATGRTESIANQREDINIQR